ncbi:hypothetical protein P3T40_005759 [Paraburkholderia sp. EB58]|jgi:hypothetical protein
MKVDGLAASSCLGISGIMLFSEYIDEPELSTY